MKLVERMQVSKSRLLRINAHLSERGLDPLQQIGPTVIALNQRLYSDQAAWANAVCTSSS